MSNIMLQSLKFPGLDDTYLIPLIQNFAPVYDSTATYAVGDYCSHDNKFYVCKTAISTAEAWTAGHWDEISVADIATAIGADVDNLKEALSDINERLDDVEDAFHKEETILSLSAFVTGKYIDKSGVETENVSTSYASVAVTSDLVGETIYISGSAWWSIKPWVFVGVSENVSYADVPSPGSTHVQYTDIEFKPSETGTLYINRYGTGGGSTQIASAKTRAIDSIKSEYVTATSVLDAIFFAPLAIGTLTQGKYINASTGIINDIQNTDYQVSDYIEIKPNTDYLITTRMNYSQGLYVWFDENNSYITGESADSGSTRTTLLNKKVTSPSNAKYLIIGFYYASSFQNPFLMEGEMNSTLPSKRWYGKKWTCLGDSLTVSPDVTYVHYHEYVAAATGISVVNLGVSGSGYAKGTSNFMAKALEVPTDSNVVTIFGSGNDASSGLELGTASDTGTTTIAGCINTTIDNLYSVMPVVQLGIVTPTPWYGKMPYDDNFMENYSNLIVEICRLRSIPCLDLFHCANLDPNSTEVRQAAYSKDNGNGTHPDEIGHAIIAPRFQAFLDSLLIH